MLFIENNIPQIFQFTDKLNTNLSNIFADNEIAKEYKVRKTKAGYLLNESLAPNFLKETVKFMLNYFFFYQLMTQIIQD